MFKKLILILTIITLMIPSSFAGIVGFDGGVTGDPTMTDNQYIYEEVLFISGEPILLKGYVTVPDIPDDSDSYNLTYVYDLENTDASASLERTINYSVTKTKNDVVSQTTSAMEITDIDEEIVVGSTTYTLESYRYDDTRMIDNTPAVDYFSGYVGVDKLYYIDGTDPTNNNGTIEYTVTSNTIVGYDHFWGNSDTRVLSHKIVAFDASGDQTWSGTADVKMSSLGRTSFQYIPTDPLSISFRGNYIKTDSQENVLQYTYDMPTSGDDSDRDRGEVNIREDVILDTTSLISPKIRDIGGHWAEDHIFLLLSLEIFDNDSEYFGPDLPISRIDFAKAIANATADIEYPTQAEIIRRDRPGTERLFTDIANTDMNYNHIEYVKEKGIMVGEGGFFKPDRQISRQEAIVIMVNALGLQYMAPNPPYLTGFADDADIPDWSRDQIYIANEIGLIGGYEDGTIRPKAYVTRAQASAMIKNFIDHIKDKVTTDYREKIINSY